jgi:hypothetical protein
MRWLPLLAIACVSPLDVDADLDGSFDAEDCGPNDPTVFPGAEEVCDNKDNDCNGEVDEGLGRPWFVDDDGDGVGDGDKIVFSCKESPEGLVLDEGDCDDGDPAISPRVLERCNGVDDDCDLDVDEPAYVEDFQEAPAEGLWAFNGDAFHEMEGEVGYLRVTDLDDDERGAAWFRESIDLHDRELRFSVYTDLGPGDGMTLTLLESLNPATLGLHGSFLGIYGIDAPGLVVEFDAWGNGGLDNTGPHTAIVDAATQVSYATGGPLAAGDWRRARVRFEDGVVSLSLDGQPRVSAEYPGGFPDRVLFGFTGANSSLNQLNRVDDLELACVFDTVE